MDDFTDIKVSESSYDAAKIGMYTIYLRDEPYYLFWLNYASTFSSNGLEDSSDTDDGLNPTDDTWCNITYQQKNMTWRLLF